MTHRIIRRSTIGLILCTGLLAACAKNESAAAPDMNDPAAMQAMMAQWEKMASPGPMHERLKAMSGVWNAKVTSWMQGPDGPASVSNCVTTCTSIMGGRYYRAEVRGQFDFGGSSRSFEGMGIYGYNNSTGKFESTWTDNMGTAMMHMTGELDKDGKSIVWTGQVVDQMTGELCTFREVDKQIDKDNSVMEMFCTRPGKAEERVMRMESTRRGARTR